MSEQEDDERSRLRLWWNEIPLLCEEEEEESVSELEKMRNMPIFSPQPSPTDLMSPSLSDFFSRGYDTHDPGFHMPNFIPRQSLLEIKCFSCSGPFISSPWRLKKLEFKSVQRDQQNWSIPTVVERITHRGFRGLKKTMKREYRSREITLQFMDVKGKMTEQEYEQICDWLDMLKLELDEALLDFIRNADITYAKKKCSSLRKYQKKRKRRSPRNSCLLEIPQYPIDEPQHIALPDRNEMVQPDSSKLQSMVEFDAKNNGAHFVREDQSCPNVSHSEKKNTRETLKRKCRSKTVPTLEDLKQHFGCKREDAAKSLDISVSTLKRICRQYEIPRWPSQKKNNVSQTDCKPREPQGEKTASRTNGQAEIGPVQVQNGFLPDFIEGPNQSNTVNLSKDDSIKTPTPTCHDSFPGNYPVMALPVLSTYKESGEAVGLSELAFQVKESTLSTAYPNPNVLAIPQPQIACKEMINENIGSSEDLRNLTASAADGFIRGKVSNSNETGPVCSDPAPAQAMTSVPHITPHLTAKQDARIVTLKATYRKNIIKFNLPLESGLVELKEAVAKRLELELGSFDVKYEDEDHEWILIACDEDLSDCLKLSSSMGNQVIRLLVLDKVAKSRNSGKSGGGPKRKRS